MTKTNKINLVSVILATVAAFIVSSIWYIIFGEVWMELRGIDPASAANQSMLAWTIAGEFGRTLILAHVMAWFVAALDINNGRKVLKLCLLIWIGFPVVILSGSVIHENVPWKIAAIHAGDWFVKPLAMLLILSFRYRKQLNKVK